MSETSELEGRVALVTGASYGLGKAIAEELGRRGGAVVLTDINDRVDDAVAELAAAGMKVSACRIDVRDRGSVDAACAHAVTQFGGLDIVVNNAAMARSAAPLMEITAEQWDATMDVNLRGTLFGMQAAVGIMIPQGRGGRIINIASTAGVKAYKQRAHYGTSKAAIIMLSRYAALEFAEHKVTVNCVAPGQTVTENLLMMTSGGLGEEQAEQMRKRQAMIPLGVNQPADIARAVAYFAAPGSATVTGQLLVVDGGGTMS